MRIMLGLDGDDTLDDITDYFRAGAEEFYAGIVPPAWYRRWGWEVSPNRRENPRPQFDDYDYLGKVMDHVHALGGQIFVALNAHEYSREQIPVVREIVKTVETHNPDAWIVAHPGIMLLLREWGINTPIHASVGTACFNQATVDYFHERLGVTRICLPRKSSLGEIKKRIEACRGSGLEFEVLAFGSRCHFIDAYCFSWHSLQCKNFCAFVLNNSSLQIAANYPSGWKKIVEDITRNPQFDREGNLNRFLMERTTRAAKWQERFYKIQNSWREDWRELKGVHPQLRTLYLGSCSLCLLKRFEQMGITTIKVPYRMGNPEAKRQWVPKIAAIIRHPEPTREMCRELVDCSGYCAKTWRCYYYPGEEK